MVQLGQFCSILFSIAICRRCSGWGVLILMRDNWIRVWVIIYIIMGIYIFSQKGEDGGKGT